MRNTGSRFEMDFDVHTAFADYRVKDGVLFIDHVEAPPALRGTGAAGKLMQAIKDHATEHNLTITPICSYAATWLKRNA